MFVGNDDKMRGHAWREARAAFDGGLGIAAVTPELVTGDQTEFDQNLHGVQAVLRAAPDLLPAFGEYALDGIAVQPVLWRA